MADYDKLPVIGSIAYPMHVLWVPWRLFMVNLGVFGTVMAVVKDMMEGLAIVGVFIAAGVWHGYVAWRFKQDPHIEGVWMTRLFFARRWPWQRTTNQVPFPGNKYGP